MPLMTWNAALATGIPSIDAEHQQLVQYVNELFDAMTHNQGREATGTILRKLADYTVKHFAHEEQIFARTAYPDSVAHLKEHRDLKQKVADFSAAFAAGKVTVTSELMHFLRTWLTDHIMHSDKKYAAHFKAKGVQ